ncbi:MAG: SUMF1/EgtB/PvdO family nonheme iron enzyme, partial [Spirochaetia bacterium]
APEKRGFSGAGPEQIEVPRRIVGSLFFPKHISVVRDLSLKNAEAYLNDSFRDISDWAMVGSFHERYRYPESITPVVEVLEKERKEDIVDPFLSAAARNLGSPEIFEDYEKALELSDRKPEQLGIDSDLLQLYRSLSEEEPIPKDVLSSLEAKVESLDFDSFYSAGKNDTADVEQNSRTDDLGLPESLEVGNSGFVSGFVLVPGSEDAPLGNENILSAFPEPSFEDLSSFPHEESFEAFFIAVSEVTERQYARFLEENPQWRRENRENLIDEGVVNADYLMNFQGDSSIPVRWVSWYAAKAYTEWFNKEYLDQQTGGEEVGAGISDSAEYTLTARLAYEGEWEYAARLNRADTFIDSRSGSEGPRPSESSRTGSLGISDLRGNLWEWTEGWYFPSEVIEGSYGNKRSNSELFEGVEKSVRGGSWVNDVRNIPVRERGSQPPDWCTPFTGFRVVLEVDHGS